MRKNFTLKSAYHDYYLCKYLFKHVINNLECEKLNCTINSGVRAPPRRIKINLITLMITL